MSAVMNTWEFEDVEKMLYAWGDECRSRADDLGLPRSSGLHKLMEQRHVYEQRLKGARRRKKQKRQTVKLIDGQAIRCACGTIHMGGLCPRCKGDPRAPDRSVHGSETRSFRPAVLKAVSASSVAVDAIVAAAPNWMRKVLMLSYLWQQRDENAALRIRVRLATYREHRAAAVEWVAQRLAIMSL